MTLDDYRFLLAAEYGIDLDVAENLRLIDLVVNEGVRKVYRDTLGLGEVSELPVTLSAAGDGDDLLPTTVLAIRDCRVGAYDLEQVTPTRIRRLREAVSTEPVANGQSWFYALDGDRKLLTFPAVEQDTVMQLNGVPAPAKLVNPEDEPELLEDLQMLVLYAAPLERLGARFNSQSTGNGASYLGRYTDELRQARYFLNKRKGRFLPSQRAGKSRTPVIYSNGRYPSGF